MIVLTTGVLVALGWPVAAALDPFAKRAARAGEALLCGSAAAVLVLEILAIAQVRWSPVTFGMPLLAIALAAWLISRRIRTAPQIVEPAGSRLWYLLDGVTALLLAADLLYSSLERPYEWDYFGIWGTKGHLFFTARSIPWSMLRNGDYHWLRPAHPVFAPLLYDAAAIVAGRWNDAHFGFFAAAFALATVLIVRGEVAAESGSRFRRSAITLAVAPAALSMWIGLAEPFLIGFATAGVLIVRRGLRDSSNVSIAAGAAFLGCAVMTKDEGIAFLVAVAASMVVASGKRWRALPQLWPAVAVALPWFIIRERVSTGSELFEGNAPDRVIGRLLHPAQILSTMWTSAVTNHLFWWAAAVTLIVFSRKLWQKERFLFVAIILLSAAYFGQNLLVPWDPVPHIVFGWSRFIDQYAAIVAFTAATILASAIEPARCTRKMALPQ